MKHLFFIVLTFFALNSSWGSAVNYNKIQSGLDVVWGMDFIDSETMIFTQRNGKLFLLNLKTKTKTEITGIPKVYSGGQGGLLDVKIHPEYSKNKWIYLTYSVEEDGKTTTRLSRAQIEGTRLVKLENLFTALQFVKSDLHFGSRIAFDHKGHVFVTVGERNERDLAQDLTTHTGKVIRLKEDGKIPEDNPFVGDQSKKPEIWSYGHRNPQGIDYDLENRQLWVSEHGPRGGDEINLIEKGKNYGWPIITYGREYWGPKIGEGSAKPGLEQPIKMYNPSIAPSSLMIYKGPKYGWKGMFLLGSLKLTHLNAVEIVDGKAKQETRHFEGKLGRIRSLTDGTDGTIYLGTDAGEIFAIQ